MATNARLRDDLEDARVHAAIAAGRHREAATLIHRAHRGAIERLTRRMLRDAAAAEDATQEALVRILRGLDRLRPDTCVRAWVLTVAAHAAIDELRRRRRRARLLVDDGAVDHVADHRPLPAQAVSARHTLATVEQRVRALPAKSRTSVALYYGTGQTYEEIGALLHERGASVQMRVRRAVGRLRAELVRRGVDDARLTA